MSKPVAMEVEDRLPEGEIVTVDNKTDEALHVEGEVEINNEQTVSTDGKGEENNLLETEEGQVKKTEVKKGHDMEGITSTPKRIYSKSRPSNRTAWRRLDLSNAEAEKLRSMLDSKRQENYNIKKKLKRYSLFKFLNTPFQTKYTAEGSAT